MLVSKKEGIRTNLTLTQMLILGESDLEIKRYLAVSNASGVPGVAN